MEKTTDIDINNKCALCALLEEADDFANFRVSKLKSKIELQPKFESILKPLSTQGASLVEFKDILVKIFDIVITNKTLFKEGTISISTAEEERGGFGGIDYACLEIKDGQIVPVEKQFTLYTSRTAFKSSERYFADNQNDLIDIIYSVIQHVCIMLNLGNHIMCFKVKRDSIRLLMYRADV